MTQLSEKDQISKTVSGRQTGRVGASDRKEEGAWLEMKEQQRNAWSKMLWCAGLGVLSLPWLTRWQWQGVLLVNKHQDTRQISSFRMWEVCHRPHSSFIPLAVILSPYPNIQEQQGHTDDESWGVCRCRRRRVRLRSCSHHKQMPADKMLTHTHALKRSWQRY